MDRIEITAQQMERANSPKNPWIAYDGNLEFTLPPHVRGEAPDEAKRRFLDSVTGTRCAVPVAVRCIRVKNRNTGEVRENVVLNGTCIGLKDFNGPFVVELD